jgi:hypothetical protein
MNENMNRRRFIIGFAGTTVAAPLIFKGLHEVFASVSGQELIGNIISQHFPGVDLPSTFLDDFYESLLYQAKRMPHFRETLNEVLKNRDQLEAFVIEEFAVRSNYFDLLHNRDISLRILPPVVLSFV